MSEALFVLFVIYLQVRAGIASSRHEAKQVAANYTDWCHQVQSRVQPGSLDAEAGIYGSTFDKVIRGMFVLEYS